MQTCFTYDIFALKPSCTS